MPTRSNARRSTLLELEVPCDASHYFRGRYSVGTRVERARAPNDRGPRVFLRGLGAPQERAEHDDDERGRTRRDRRPVDAGGVFDRLWSGEPVAGRLRVAGTP